MSIYEFMIYQNKTWLKVFYHDSSQNEFFTEKEARYNIGNPNKFSLLQNMHHFAKEIHYYEFLLEYPDLKGCMHWKQKINPMELTEASAVNHFECINCTWSTYFQGLFLSPGSDTLLEGDKRATGFWRFSIGAYRAWSGVKFPGPSTGPSTGIDVTKAKLWLRVLFTTKPRKIPHIRISIFVYYLFTKQS